MKRSEVEEAGIDLDTPLIDQETYKAEFHRRKHKGLRDWQSNPDRDVGSKMPRMSKTLLNTSRSIKPLVAPSIDLISNAITGGLVPHKEVFKGSQEEKQSILETDSSAIFIQEELNGKLVDVIVTYSPVSSQELNTAKWIVQMDKDLKKAAEDSRIKKLEALVKEYRAKEAGILPKDDEVKRKEAQAFGGPRKLNNEYNPEWENLPTAEDFYDTESEEDN